MSDGRGPRFWSPSGDIEWLSLAGACGTGRIAGEADGVRSESAGVSRWLSEAGGRGTGRIAGEADGPRSAMSGVSECDIREVGVPVGRSAAERLFSGGRGTECVAPE